MTTPTPADHDAARRLANRAALHIHPWQLEHLAAAIAVARAEGVATGYREGREDRDRLRAERDRARAEGGRWRSCGPQRGGSQSPRVPSPDPSG